MALKRPKQTLDPEEFVKLFGEALGDGELDTVLDKLFDLVDRRILKYQEGEAHPYPIGDMAQTLQIMRRFREGDVIPDVGGTYGLIGKKYDGVTVQYLGSTSDGLKRRVEVIGAPIESPVVPGEIYQVPVGALTTLYERAECA